MSGKGRSIAILTASFALFLVLGLLLDGDLFRYPLLRMERFEEREREAVLASIDRYNAILTDLYVSDGVPALLNEFPATKAVRHGLFRDIGFVRGEDRVLVYDLAGISPVNVRILSPSTAEAVVFEEWNYTYQRTSDRRPVTRIRGLGQGYRYRLVRSEGSWMVAQWDPVEVIDPVLAGSEADR